MCEWGMHLKIYKRVLLQHTFRNEKVNRLTFSLFVLFFYIKHMIIDFCVAAT